MTNDALTVLLKRAKLTDSQRAGLWDLYQISADEDDIAERLKSLQLPSDIKADLWDLKASEKTKQTKQEPQAEPVKPSEGYWEDRGIAGKVWHPASGVTERNRSDVQVLGMPPEIAAIGAGTVGRAVIAPGLSAAGRVAAGAAAAAGQAAPIIGYEAARQGLRFVGVPEPFASIAAGVVTARRMGKSAAAETESAVAAEVAPVPAPTAATTGARRAATAAEEQLTPLELTRKLKAEWRAAHPQPSPEVVKQEFKAVTSKVPKLTVDEMAAGAKMLQAGMSGPEVLETILKRRSQARP